MMTDLNRPAVVREKNASNDSVAPLNGFPMPSVVSRTSCFEHPCAVPAAMKGSMGGLYV